MEDKKTRREFIQASTAVAGSMAFTGSVLGQSSSSSAGIPTRILGRTGDSGVHDLPGRVAYWCDPGQS